MTFRSGRTFAAGLIAATTLSLPSAAQKPAGDRSSAYYHASLGHLYEELAGAYSGRGEYLDKAIENYKLALRADPESSFLANELADLYLQSGQLRTAVNEFEEAAKRNPEDVNAHRILGRLYMARIRDGQQARLNNEMVRKSIEQYSKVAEKVPADLENWVLLGRLHKLAQNSTDAEKAYKKALALDANNEDAMAGLAMVYSDQGDTKNATEMLRRVAEKNPSLRTLTALAGTYEQMKDYKLAAETYRRAVEMNPGNADLKRAYAQALFSADDVDGAKKAFEELAAEDPNDLLSVLRLSQIYRQKRDFAKAREYSKKAKDLDPKNVEIQYNEVSLLEAEGKLPEAIAAMKEILALSPKRPDSLSEKSNRIILLERLGYLYRQAEQTEDAVASFREIIELDPDVGGRASAQVIEAYRGAKDFDAAEREADAAARKYPNERIVKIMQANVQTDRAKFDLAAATIKSLMDGKNDRETWLSLTQIYEKAKNYPEMTKAIDAAEKLSTTDEEKETVYFMRGAMLEKQKKFDASEVEFRKALALNPGSPAALNYLGYMLADRNVRLQEALEMIKKAVDQEPANAAYLDSLGWVYYRLNRQDEAVELLKRSIERSQRDPAVYDHLGDVLMSQGKVKDAVAQWEKSLAEWHANAPSDRDETEIARVQKKLEGAKVRLAQEKKP